MNNNLEFENEDPFPDSIEDNHPRTNYGEGYGGKETLEKAVNNFKKTDVYVNEIKQAQERMYSKEDILTNIELAMIQGLTLGEYRDLLIEQFKKK
jgi:hypothetical protein